MSKTELIQFLPETFPYDEADISQLFEKYNIIYLKPTTGCKGEGVYRIKIDATGKMSLSHHHISPTTITKEIVLLKNEIKKRIGSRRYIAQQGISFMQYNERNFDIRVLMQKNNTGLWHVTNIISRIAHTGYFNTSISESISPSEEILQTLLNLQLLNT